jgi:tetrapyrrole methylase family protein/MazG family protein
MTFNIVYTAHNSFSRNGSDNAGFGGLLNPDRTEQDMDNTDRNIEREIESLRKTLRVLRGENGCPWDREQSMDDIISNLIDESYELLQAEKLKDWDEVEEELGDVLFLVIFAHELLLEKRMTPLSDIVSRVHRKIVNRHPHVFGQASARTSAESVAEWEKMKKAENSKRELSGILRHLPPGLHPLRRATTIQKKAAGVGFDWPDHHQILEKMREETEELERALQGGNRERIKGEIGDILFTIVNLARRLEVDPENALEITSAKFMKRFNEMERRAGEAGKTLDSMTIEEMEDLWQESKQGK